MNWFPLFSSKGILLVFFTCLLCTQVWAQKRIIDSLHRAEILHPNDDTIKVNLYDKLGFAQRFFGPDSVMFYANKVAELSTKLSYRKGMAASYKLKSMALFMQGDVLGGIEFANKSLDIYVALGDAKAEASILNNLGMFYYEMGEHHKSIEYYKHSLAIRERLNHGAEIADSYNNLGNAYNSLGDYAEALSYHFKALSYREHSEKIEDLGDSYTNISSVYFMIHSYDEALVYAKKAYVIFMKTGQADGVLNAMLNFGSIYTELNQPKKALGYYHQALVLNNQLKFGINAATVYYNIGHIYLQQHELNKAKSYLDSAVLFANSSYNNEAFALTNVDLGELAIIGKNYSLAESYLRKALNIAKFIDSKSRQHEISKRLAQLLVLKGNYKEAYTYMTDAIALGDSVHAARIDKGIYQSKLDYLLENHKQKIDLLEKDQSLQNANLKFQRLLLTSLALTIVLLGGIIFIQRRNVLRSRKTQAVIMQQSNELMEQATKLQEVNRVKDKVFSVLSHDLRNPINSLTSVMNMLNTDMLTVEEFGMMRDKFSVQLRTVNLMLDNLLHWSRANLRGIIDTNKSVVQVNKTVQQVCLLTNEVARNKQIKVESGLSLDSTVYADADHLDIIFRNVISNALKFTPVGGTITITDKVVGDKRLISIRDSGVGMSEEKIRELFTDLPLVSQYGTKGEKGTGIGLLITKEFVQINNGTINVESKPNEGTNFILSFPLRQA